MSEASSSAIAPARVIAALRAQGKRLLPFLPLAVVTSLLARSSIQAVLGKLGHPGAALDDAYIHFQYARAFAEGHPLRFQAGEPISTGATSFLWPAVLAVPYALGVRGESILWATWVLSFVALGALAYESFAITRPLAGRAAGFGAGAMTLLFGGFAWSAASGMEVVPFAWVLLHSMRRASEWTEDPARRTPRELRILLALAVVAPLVRPEGAIASVVLAIAVAMAPRVGGLRGRAEALPVLLAAAVPNVLLLVLTGHATSSTAQVKLLVGNPYFAMPDAALANARILVAQILDGEVWSAEFLPKGGAPLACAGLVALVWRGRAASRPFRAMAVLVLALAMFVPCLYVTFLWNRLRYLWPFAPGWFVGLACLARAVGAIVGRIDARAGATATTLVAGGFAGTLAVRLEWVIDDAAQSASGIDRQQVALGRWADGALPRDARIGVNDTGRSPTSATERPSTWSVSRRRAKDATGWRAPAHGSSTTSACVCRRRRRCRHTSSSTRSGWGATRCSAKRSTRPSSPTRRSSAGRSCARTRRATSTSVRANCRGPSTAVISDTLDVADLESEAEHRYELLGAHDGEQVAEEANAPDGHIVVDGGRTQRSRERFVAKLSRGVKTIALGRVQASSEVSELEVRVGDRVVGKAKVEPGPWTEVAVVIPGDAITSDAMTIEVTATGSAYTSFHWWFSPAL